MPHTEGTPGWSGGRGGNEGGLGQSLSWGSGSKDKAGQVDRWPV